MTARSYCRAVDPVRLGLQMRALRRRRGWRQLDLAVAAGTSQDMVSRVERGLITNVACGMLAALSNALGARLVLELRWHGEGLARLLDQDHADIVDQVVRLLQRYGWETAVEVSFQVGREIGSIDVVGWRASHQALVIVEVKSVVPDEQQMHSSLDRKARLAPIVVRERGWTAIRVGRLLVVGESGTARRRIARHGATFTAAFPSRGRQVRDWLRDPVGQRFAGLLFLPATQGVRARQRVRRVRAPQPDRSSVARGKAASLDRRNARNDARGA